MSAAESPELRPRTPWRTFGSRAQLFEAAPALGEIGAAVNVSPQAVKALRAIGRGDKVAAVGYPLREFTPETCTPGSSSNSTIASRPANDTARPTTPSIAPTCWMRSQADSIRGFTSDHQPHRHRGTKRRYGLLFANGQRQAEFVIAADGVRSVIRRALYGA